MKTLKLLAFRRAIPFIDCRRKKRVFEEVLPYIKKGMLSTFLVAYA